MVTPWCVKITCLPPDSNNDELANKLGVDRDIVDVPRNQQGPNYYARINGFSSEQHANEFVKKWNNQRIRTGTIKCKALPTNAHVMQTRPPSLARSTTSRSDQDNTPKQFGSTTRAQNVEHERK